MSEVLTAPIVEVTVAELDQAADVLARYSKIIASQGVEWHAIRAAWNVIVDATTLAKFGEPSRV